MRMRHPCPIKLFAGRLLSLAPLTISRVCVLFGDSYASARSDFSFGISVSHVPSFGALQLCHPLEMHLYCLSSCILLSSIAAPGIYGGFVMLYLMSSVFFPSSKIMRTCK